MLDRQACERRVYRLATLLSGDPAAATRVISDVLDAQPDLARLDSTHADRLTILRTRELLASMPKSTAAIIVDDALPHDIARALAHLEPQQREAWVLMRVYRMTDRETARTMDCSATATARHVELAESALREARGRERAEAAAEAVRTYAMSIDVPPFHRRRIRRRRQMRLLAWLAIPVAIAVLALWLWQRM